MKKFIIFVGLDVHKNTIDVAIAEAGRNSEVRYYGTIGGGLDDLDCLIKNFLLPAKNHTLFTRPVPVVMTFFAL